MLNWLQKICRNQPRTLYHGTCVFNKESIQSLGLVPQAGPFVQRSYEDEYAAVGVELPELIFAADKANLDRAVGAMINCISHHTGMGFHDVTDSDVRKFGMLAILKESDWQQRIEDERYFSQEGFETVEPGDYFSEEQSQPDALLTGNTLIKFLRRYGVWPRNWGPDRSNNMKEFLIRSALKQHPEKTREEILNRINNLPPEQIEKFYYSYPAPRK